ncbi:MAG: methanol--corrinoid methyltransferase [Anaerolineae bacterium]|nr:methanol--corrinoid methyltransferase [Anaerolineae bacterium]
MRAFTHLAITRSDDLIYGRCPYPIRLKSGLEIGGGMVYPEINFTLPPMIVNAVTMPDVREQYQSIIDAVCGRAVELHAPGLVVEFEMLPDMTLVPEWGVEVVTILRETLDRYAAKGLKSGLRVTPNDIREFDRPPQMREGKYWDEMLASFEGSVRAGADMLAIESTGGKEIHDSAILNADMPQIALALGVLAPRDMAYLWDHIVEIAERYGAVPSGDSACGFANTAMVLAETRHIPRVLAALIRVMTVPRSLVAFERGAVGPSKDCAYEGPYIKAITGCPIALEGAEAACAHLSPIGNIAKATADLWSNESVQNVRLLGATAPVVSVEQLVYATRLMNTAAQHGTDGALMLRDWFVQSDASLDPQAFVLRPDVVMKLAQEIIAEKTPYQRTRRAGIATMAALRQAQASGELELSRAEQRWLDRLSAALDELPESEDELIAQVVPTLDHSKIRLDQYLLEASGV